MTLKAGDVRRYKHGPGMYVLLKHESKHDFWTAICIETERSSVITLTSPDVDVLGGVCELSRMWIERHTESVA